MIHKQPKNMSGMPAIISMIGIVTYLIGYVIVSISLKENESFLLIINSYVLLGNICLLIGSGFLIYNRQAEWRWYWVFITFAICSHVFGDIQFVIADLKGVSLPLLDGSTFAYILANAFLLLGLLSLVLNQKNRLHIFQLLVDTIATVTLLGVIVWYLFGLQRYFIQDVLTVEAWLIFAYLSVDIILLVVLTIIYQVYRQFRLSKTVNWLIFLQISGFIIFCLADFIEFYFIVQGTVAQAQQLEVMWTIGFILIVSAGFLTLKYQNKILVAEQHPLQIETKIPTNIGVQTINYLYGLAFLAMIVSQFAFGVIIVASGVVIVRYIISMYLEIYLRNQILLEQYKQINNELEKTVEKRTLEIVEKNRELEQLANYDSLTELPNSRFFTRYLAEKLERDQPFAILFTDLDRFKVINDWYGHDRGDALLQAVAKRLQAQLPETAFLARLGGDEFVIILPLDQPVTEIAQRIVTAFRQSFLLAGHHTHTTISIGISQYPEDAENEADLIKFADIALYDVKNANKNNFAYYNKVEATNQIQAFAIEHELYNALENQEFMVYYQPQFDLQNRQLVGFEALIRWQHPTLGMIVPEQFIPIAEDIGLIHEVGEWVLMTALQQLKAWQAITDKKLKIAVNLSPKQLQCPEFVGRLSHLLSTVELNAEQLELEITESSFVKEEKIKVTLYKLQLLGIPIAIDDFGTGYSSLGQLKRLPIQKIKIARELIADIANSQVDQAIVEALIKMAKKLEIITIAEGVETESELQFLEQLGCEHVQSYYFCPPLPANEVAARYFKMT
ncbi:MAG: putative bifunctional diguanylate cyclase/phosphodiesterase [Culicoidibacterales bacterium]